MKKIVALMLVISLLLALGGCGKSEEAAEVDEMILALEAMPLEYLEEVDEARIAVNEAKAAYDALTEKQKDEIEYYDILLEAEQSIFAAEYEFVFLLIQFLDLSADEVTSSIATIWDNVGASDFYTYFTAVSMFDDDEKVLSDYVAIYDGAATFLWGAGYALCPEYVSGGQVTNEAGIIKTCAAFNTCYANLEEGMDNIQERVSRLNSTYADTYPAKMEALYDLWVECSLYFDLALEPEGSLASYSEAVSNFRSNIDRYIKDVEMHQ